MSVKLDAFKAMAQGGDYVILDTETTGLERGEIVQIALIDADGTVLLDTLVKPVNAIPPEATAVHGITDADVVDAPTWAEVTLEVQRILTGRNVIIYNAVYDRKMMHQSAEAADLLKVDWKELGQFWCAMEAFAEIFADWNDYRQSYRWQKLSKAAMCYAVKESGAHSALGDCLTTLAIVRAMAEDREFA